MVSIIDVVDEFDPRNFNLFFEVPKKKRYHLSALPQHFKDTVKTELFLLFGFLKNAFDKLHAGYSA